MSGTDTSLRAVLLDFGGTLDADGVAWKERFRRLFAEEGAPAAEGFDRAFYDADDALVGAVPRDLPFSQTVERLCVDVAAKLGRPETAGRVAERFLADARACLDRNAPLLERLHGRYRLGVVSNFYGNLESVCREMGLSPHLDAAIDSAVVRSEKPDRRIFDAALSAVHVEPSEAIFVGDSLARDMAGAKAAGIRHVWLRAGEGNACCPEDRVIASLPELSAVLA